MNYITYDSDQTEGGIAQDDQQDRGEGEGVLPDDLITTSESL